MEPTEGRITQELEDSEKWTKKVEEYVLYETEWAALTGPNFAATFGGNEKSAPIERYVAPSTLPRLTFPSAVALNVDGIIEISDEKLRDAVLSISEKMCQCMDKDFIHALTCGVSLYMSDIFDCPTVKTKLHCHSHGNFHIAGMTKVSYNHGKPNTCGYEIEVKSEIDRISSKGYEYSLAQILFLEGLAAVCHIPKIKTKYGDFYIHVVAPKQKYQLQQSSDDFNKLFMSGSRSFFPLIRNFCGLISNTIIISSYGVVGVQLVNDELGNCAIYDRKYNYMPVYGPKEYYKQRLLQDTNSIKIGFLLGAGAITHVIGSPMIRLFYEYDPVERVQYLKGELYSAYVLNDIFDSVTKEFVYNQSSIAFATYSQ